LREIDKLFEQVCVIELAIEHVTGKEAIELIRGKNLGCNPLRLPLVKGERWLSSCSKFFFKLEERG